MPKLQVWAELSEETYRAYRGEALRRGVPVETLVEQTINELLRELESDEKDGTDHLIFPS
ncbi:MAG TPA: hypothetical protein VNI57_04625 [Candidatus Saccharimonadales bacterium]|nr:hypothetical protein [Candidatus Saccharimonadales bacterium]